MLLNSQIFIVCLLLVIKFKTHLGQETSNIQSDGNAYANDSRATLTIPEVKKTASTDSTIYDNKNNFHNEEPNRYNKSIEYLIEDPNTTIRRHEQEVIIKPLNYFKNQPTSLPPLAESSQELLLKSRNRENQSVQELNVQPTTVTTNVTESQFGKMIAPSNETKEVLIINLLNPQNQFAVRESIQSLKDSQKEEIREVLRQTDQISMSLENNEKAAMSLHDHGQQLIFKVINTDNQSTEPNKKEDQIFKPINLLKQYPLTTKEETTTLNVDREISTTLKHVDNQTIDFEKEDSSTLIEFKNRTGSLIQKPPAQESITSTNETHDKIVKNTVEAIVQTPSSPTSESESSEENKDLNPKPLVTLEDYAIKQMDFILDHMLLESQQFVAKVLQATGNTLFQRDPLKRYAENLNNLLNPQLESDYSDEFYVPSGTVQQDVYEEVIKKFNFLKSKATKELQHHLPANWIKEYQDKKEELKIWLNKASDEMHRVFNFYVDDEMDHIRYLYFNEAFDDIARATEIHQKLALMADLIKIVKNKKQITFMDLYMQ
ncbi:hypothetical protein DOY81_000071 [Sarcophaga bullata]|nr:hypothetical protein DOY81_000071 [Sarcophaga bullata]